MSRTLIATGLALALAWPAADAQPAIAPSRIAADGITLHYVERGGGDAVVLVHGSLADYTYWLDTNQVTPLAGRYRVIAYSRRYNYPNDNPPDRRHSAIVEAADLLRLVDALHIDRVHLVGHSYGAYTALAFAVEHPDRVRTLVLAEPPIIAWLPDLPGGAELKTRFMTRVWEPLAKAFAEGGDGAGLDFTARWYFNVPMTDAPVQWQAAMKRNVREWRALADSPDAYPMIDYDKVRAFRAPTLVLTGSKSTGKQRVLIDDRLMELLPNAQRRVVDDASHEMFEDRPAQTHAIIAEFIRTCGEAAPGAPAPCVRPVPSR